MKNLKYLLFATIILLTVNSCKKGDDDPFFSIYSRKARLTNEWILTEGSQTGTQTNGSNTMIIEYSFTEDSIFMYLEDEKFAFTYKETFTFKEDEKFIINIEQGLYESEFYTITYEGEWMFLSSEGDYKNKERVKLKIEKMTTSYGGLSTTTPYTEDDVTYILYLTKLSNDELNFDFDFIIQDGTTDIEITGTKKFVEK